jgi:hypothetical protein
MGQVWALKCNVTLPLFPLILVWLGAVSGCMQIRAYIMCGSFLRAPAGAPPPPLHYMGGLFVLKRGLFPRQKLGGGGRLGRYVGKF